MVDYNQWLRASQQHLAHLQQEEALVHQHQVALVEIQDLERQRLQPGLQVLVHRQQPQVEQPQGSVLQQQCQQ
jgi:hypothetical protein